MDIWKYNNSLLKESLPVEERDEYQKWKSENDKPVTMDDRVKKYRQKDVDDILDKLWSLETDVIDEYKRIVDPSIRDLGVCIYNYEDGMNVKEYYRLNFHSLCWDDGDEVSFIDVRLYDKNDKYGTPRSLAGVFSSELVVSSNSYYLDMDSADGLIKDIKTSGLVKRQYLSYIYDGLKYIKNHLVEVPEEIDDLGTLWHWYIDVSLGRARTADFELCKQILVTMLVLGVVGREDEKMDKKADQWYKDNYPDEY